MMIFFRQILFFASFLLMLLVTKGQAQKPSMEDFTTIGDTRKTGDRCYRLTEAVDWSSGSIWHRTPIDMKAPFEMELNLMLGCQDRSGADGMVFVFTPQRTRLGRRGEGMGFSGLVPSLGIEIDTWENEHLGDPPGDHVALLANGQVSHYRSLVGPVNIPNVEDCSPHRLNVRWTPARQHLEVKLDGRSVISVKYDIVSRIFYGEKKIYWGVTSATGEYNNRHEICFEKLDYLPALEGLEFDVVTYRRLLGGDIMPLRSLQYETGKSDLESSSFPDLERLVNLLERNPDMSLEIFGHTDNVGDARSNLSLSQLRAKAVADYLIKKGISKDRIYARGFGEKYPLASNATRQGRMQNRRVEIHLFLPVP
jgi:hypothetical protein